jgi:hypothetical protein
MKNIENIKEFKINKKYTYVEITDFIDRNDEEFYFKELGNNLIGESFMIIYSTNSTRLISFVFSNYTTRDYVYMCVYSDYDDFN